MWSWSREARLAVAATAAAAASLAILASGAAAAEYSVQPIVSLEATTNTNVDLTPVPSERQSTQGYYADAATVIGIATPDSQTTVKPRIVYDYYPSIPELDRIEGYLDISSALTLPRDQLAFAGRYERLNDLHAEAPGPDYNPVTPGLPTTPTSGSIAYGSVVDLAILAPAYTHNITPTSSFGLSGTYERMTFSPDDDVAHVDFNYGMGKIQYTWSGTPRGSISVGGFGSTYQALNIDARSTTGGGEIDFRYNWTPLWRSSLTLLDQQMRVDDRTPLAYRSSANAWGLGFQTTYDGRLDQLRMSLSRTLAPSSAGGLYNTDEAQLQYDHDVGERLETGGAVRYLSTRNLGSTLLDFTRDYATAQGYVEWMLTPLLYLEGSYTIAWQKYQIVPGNAIDHIFSIEIGYRGLPRQH